MTSSNPPIYYFSGIGFNNSFYSYTSSGLTLSQAKNTFLQKKVTDTATATETFSAGIVSSSIQATTNALTLYTSSPSSSTLTMGNTNLNMSIQSATTFNNPISMSISSNANSNTNLGYIVNSFYFAGRIQSTSTGASGSYPIYTTPSQLPIGTYLVTASCVLSYTGGSTAGTVSNIEGGITYGANSSGASNTLSPTYRSIANTTASVGGVAFNRDYEFTISMPVYVATNNYYLGVYATYTIGTAFSPGASQISILSYSITRIG